MVSDPYNEPTEVGVLSSNKTFDPGPSSLPFFMGMSLPRWEGYTYSLSDNPDFPYGTPGVPTSMVDTGTKTVQCTAFTWATLTSIYPKDLFDFEWYKVHNLWAPHSRFDNLAYAYQKGIVEIPTEGVGTQNGWYLVQEWNATFTSGHSYFVWVYQGKYRILEASGKKPDWGAVVWRSMGPAQSTQDFVGWCTLDELNMRDIVKSSRLK